jgi:hypothetical protein
MIASESARRQEVQSARNQKNEPDVGLETGEPIKLENMKHTHWMK